MTATAATRRQPVLAILLFLLLVAAGCSDITPPGPQLPASSFSAVGHETGSFHVTWGDPALRSTPRQDFFMVNDAGVSTRLELSDVLLQQLGGARALDRKRVR